jgi:hypothetical protein
MLHHGPQHKENFPCVSQTVSLPSRLLEMFGRTPLSQGPNGFHFCWSMKKHFKEKHFWHHHKIKAKV